jgi:hypothetical protein
MKPEKIIELAMISGFQSKEDYQEYLSLCTFAKLISAAEREAILQDIDRLVDRLGPATGNGCDAVAQNNGVVMAYNEVLKRCSK